jgi:hypothetical protein
VKEVREIELKLRERDGVVKRGEGGLLSEEGGEVRHVLMQTS